MGNFNDRAKFAMLICQSTELQWIDPVDDGTLVTETFDWSTAIEREPIERIPTI